MVSTFFHALHIDSLSSFFASVLVVNKDEHLVSYNFHSPFVVRRHVTRFTASIIISLGCFWPGGGRALNAGAIRHSLRAISIGNLLLTFHSPTFARAEARKPGGHPLILIFNKSSSQTMCCCGKNLFGAAVPRVNFNLLRQ